MKTPREVLFERHRSAETQLEAVRQKVLASLVKVPARKWLAEKDSSNVRGSLRELLLSFRWHVAGMSAVWLVVVLLNVDHTPAPTAAMAEQKIPSPRQLLAALRENRRQILELIEPPFSESIPAPAPVVPRRRSELPSSGAMI